MNKQSMWPDTAQKPTWNADITMHANQCIKMRMQVSGAWQQTRD